MLSILGVQHVHATFHSVKLPEFKLPKVCYLVQSTCLLNSIVVMQVAMEDA
jgi:hypothetical protein